MALPVTSGIQRGSLPRGEDPSPRQPAACDPVDPACPQTELPELAQEHSKAAQAP